MDEQPRPDANADERAYTLTVDEVLPRYEAAGHARTSRAIQKYCARGDLDCLKEETTYGRRYRVTPASVVRHLEQIEQTSQTKERGHPRPDANVRVLEYETGTEQKDDPSVREQPRPAATDTRYVMQLESEITFLRDQIGRKDHQIEQRDIQVEAMIERDRETNILIEQLQRRIPMLAQPERRDEATTIPHTDIPREPATGE
jgi:hypothetical protein